MPLGNLDRLIVIENYLQPYDGNYGERLRNFSTYKTVWAEKLDDEGARESAEEVYSEKLAAKRITKWRIRYDSTIKERMRINYNDRYYNIISIAEEGRNRFLLLTTTSLDD